MADLELLLERRIEAILRSDPSLCADYEVVRDREEGMDWGLIVIMDDTSEIVRCEFIESEVSWMRPEAIDEYNELADEGVPVTVVVPNEAFLAMSTRAQKYGSRDISVFGYDSILMRVKGLPP